jgi:ribosomal protein L24E
MKLTVAGNAVTELILTSLEVKQFADKHHVTSKRDSCGERIIPGSVGHIYGNGDGRFGVLLQCKSKTQWTFAKKKLREAGFTISQNAETEGTALFDPNDKKQVRLALKLARVPRQRNLTEEQRQAASERMKKARDVKKLLLKTRDFERKATDDANVTPEGHENELPPESPSFPTMGVRENASVRIEG